jgi:hypothetical protein
MKKVKNFNYFLNEDSKKIEYDNIGGGFSVIKGWDNMSDNEKHEILFGKHTNLDKEFSKIMIDNLCSDDDKNVRKWSTYNAVKIYLEEYDESYVKELKYRITDGENPKKVILSIINNIKNPNKELIRLKNKISDFDM